jgi:hypothetical protein
MKQLFILFAIFTCSLAVVAQGNSNNKGKGKNKVKAKTHSNTTVPDRNRDEDYGYQTNNQANNAKHVPKKVTSALYRDYPNARNVTWGKYKGDYTATFGNGLWRSTAVYHANGERRDTRTRIQRRDLPGNIWDGIFRRDNIDPKDYTVIERPSVAERIYRVLTGSNTAYYYDAQGNRVQYKYW